MKITDEALDRWSGYRTGRYGEWLVRTRPGGAVFDLARSPFNGWEKADYKDLTLDQASRILGVPRGELYDWGCG